MQEIMGYVRQLQMEAGEGSWFEIPMFMVCKKTGLTRKEVEKKLKANNVHFKVDVNGDITMKVVL